MLREQLKSRQSVKLLQSLSMLSAQAAAVFSGPDRDGAGVAARAIHGHARVDRRRAAVGVDGAEALRAAGGEDETGTKDPTKASHSTLSRAHSGRAHAPPPTTLSAEAKPPLRRAAARVALAAVEHQGSPVATRA